MKTITSLPWSYKWFNKWFQILILMTFVSALLPDIAVAQTLSPEVMTDNYLATLGDEARAKSDNYFEGGYWLQLWNFILAMVIAWGLMRSGLSVKMRNWSENKVKSPWLSVPLYIAPYVLLTTLFTLPLTIYQSYFREQQYGLLNQSFGPWFAEQMISMAISVIMMMFLFTVIYAVIRRTKQWWWVWGTLITSSFMAFILMVAPVFISPLFNTYTPMEEGPLKVEILNMAKANGVPTDNVWVYDASKQTDKISANVSGLFGTMRISLNDNLLNRSTPEEIKAVMGHELGHYVLGHGPEMLVNFSLVLLLAMLFVQGGFAWVQQRWGQQWGVRDLADPAGLPVIFAVITVYFFLATPATNSIVRTGETEADSFAVNASQEPDGLATALLKLTEYRKADPGPWEEIVFFDHPGTRNRILSAMRYKAVYQSGEK